MSVIEIWRDRRPDTDEQWADVRVDAQDAILLEAGAFLLLETGDKVLKD